MTDETKPTFTDPRAVEQAFYDAFRRLDEPLMRHVWLQSNETSCIHPGGGLLQGTEAIINSWKDIFQDASPPRVAPRLVQASADNRLAVHTVEERISSGGGGRRAVVLATNIYVHAQDGWHMLAHHASLPLVESDSSPTAATPAAIH